MAQAQLAGARGPQTPATFDELLVAESARALTLNVDSHAPRKASASPVVLLL